MLEPRRIAARAAAHRMASLLGERVGDSVGYRVRADARVGAQTRVEVVTEGILTRLILNDPTLEGTGLVIVDEFHERSLHADLALALTLHTQQLVRPELRVLVMSATLDATRVADLMDAAPVVTSAGQAFPVETIYRPTKPGISLAAAVGTAVSVALSDGDGDILVFLPGQREIGDVADWLGQRALPNGTVVVPLYGQLSADEQDRAIAPAPLGTRKVVLATAVAETSLTIEAVRIVIDAGLSRVPRFSPASGMTRLETIRVSRAAADQRRGRAGRTAPGVCYRLWHAHETELLMPFASPEILDADLAPLALDLAVAGIADPGILRWLDPPPKASLSQGRELLRELDAVDSSGGISMHGTRMSRIGAHPRLAHMLCVASDRGLGALGADLAALLDDRDVLRGDGAPPPADIRLRLDALRGAARTEGGRVDAHTLHRIRAAAARWRRILDIEAGDDSPECAGMLLALAYPDRIALRRPGRAPRYVMRGGGGVRLRDDDPLVGEEVLAIAETDGRRPEALAYLAAPISREDVLATFASHVVTQDVVEWDGTARAMRADREARLGAILLSRHAIADPDTVSMRHAMQLAIEREGIGTLPWSDTAVALRQRLLFLHAHDSRFPDVSDAALIIALDDWLGHALNSVRRVANVAHLDLGAALLSLLDRTLRSDVDRLAPTHVTVPTGSRIPIDYANPQAPTLSVRLQEMFGCTETPSVLGGRVPLTLHLLSPAHRPVQVTRDLRGFWQSSYFDVRKDLRGRYPKHEWPDDPLLAAPTRRARRPR
ncbi:MAG: hypothetical protein MNPFHGCM_00182 [Gemmatimonadaceae bacterium]|nr:hypothetical protein [Gemmatimonadaceae bacterium]